MLTTSGKQSNNNWEHERQWCQSFLLWTSLVMAYLVAGIILSSTVIMLWGSRKWITFIDQKQYHKCWKATVYF